MMVTFWPSSRRLAMRPPQESAASSGWGEMKTWVIAAEDSIGEDPVVGRSGGGRRATGRTKRRASGERRTSGVPCGRDPASRPRGSGAPCRPSYDPSGTEANAGATAAAGRRRTACAQDSSWTVFRST